MHGRNEQQSEKVFSENMNSKLADSPSLPSASVNLLKKYFESKLMREKSISTPSRTSCPPKQELSTNGILTMARERLLQCNTQNLDLVSLLASDLFDADASLPSERKQDYELALLLQAAALKFNSQQFDRARSLLNLCQASASVTGRALQRIVYYFSAALQERISRATGIVVPEASEGSQRMPSLEEALTTVQPAVIESLQEIPIYQVTQFTAIQAIVDNLAAAKRVHIVDLGIKCGLHWPVIMQALAGRHECQLELLKITAVGPHKERIEEIGKMLSSFAETIDVPFAFKLIVSEMKDLKEDFFELEEDEVLAVYSNMRLASLLPSPDHLESLVRTIAKLNPCVMVIIEIESNTNTPNFLDRFDAALSLCAAAFDCHDDCMERENSCRALLEGVFFWEEIQNTITAEGEERIHRREVLDFWRAYLSRFGIVEIALSDLALCQSQLVVKTNPSWSSCTLELNGKGLIIGWKGTPILSLSVWKFNQDDG